MDEFGKVGAEMSHIQSQMRSDYDSAESTAESDLEVGELRKMLASQLYLKTVNHLGHQLHRGNLLHCYRRGGASANRTLADSREKLDVKFVSGAEEHW